jgi:hypothetical protein
MRDYFAEASAKAAAVAGGSCVYNPTKHYILPEGDFIRAIRIAAKQMSCKVADDLFLYHHKITKAWVLAYWVPELAEVKAMCEVFLFEENPCGITKKPLPPKEAILESLRPRHARSKELLKQLREEEYEAAKEKRQKEENTQAYARALKLGGMEEEAQEVSTHMAAVDFPKGVSL